jgi:sugar lactone lactonase YvrE
LTDARQSSYHQRVKTTLVADHLYFPEAARWYGGRLWFGDIQAARVSAVTPGGPPTVIAQFASPCSGIGFLADGTPLVSLMRERKLVRVTPSGGFEVHSDLEGFGCDHINDIVTDALGRAYVDSLAYHMHWMPPETVDGQTIYRFENQAKSTRETVTDTLVLADVDGSARIVATDLLGPNGLAITGDGSHLIVAEWRAHRITRFRILDDGSLTDRKHFGDTPGLPDGLCVDVEDAVWYSSPETGDCVRMAFGGKILERVVPSYGRRVTSCVLGGHDRRDLFLTTDRNPELGGGCIEVTRVQVQGAGYP